MKKQIITLVIVGIFLLLPIPTVLGNEAKINNDEWKIISINGKCDYFSCGTILHFFGIWTTSQQMSFYGVTEDTEIKINGEVYPIEENSKVKFHGFVGKAIFPFERITKEKQGLERPLSKDLWYANAYHITGSGNI
jgi:hypothetical protein